MCTLTCSATNATAIVQDVMARVEVPNGMIPQGAILLIRQTDSTVVRTVLRTRFVQRIKTHIISNERLNWKTHADAEAYIKMLETAFSEYKSRKTKTKASLALVIDIIDAPNSARIEFSISQVATEKHNFKVQPAPVWKRLPLSRDYIRRDQEFILTDAFKNRAPGVIKQLRPYPAQEGVSNHE
jgi:hypothetical protein